MFDASSNHEQQGRQRQAGELRRPRDVHKKTAQEKDLRKNLWIVKANVLVCGDTKDHRTKKRTEQRGSIVPAQPPNDETNQQAGDREGYER